MWREQTDINGTEDHRGHCGFRNKIKWKEKKIEKAEGGWRCWLSGASSSKFREQQQYKLGVRFVQILKVWPQRCPQWRQVSHTLRLLAGIGFQRSPPNRFPLLI